MSKTKQKKREREVEYEDAVLVQTIKTSHDQAGNPRRLWVLYTRDGEIVDTIEHGYCSMPTFIRELTELPSVTVAPQEWRIFLQLGMRRDGDDAQRIWNEVPEELRESCAYADDSERAKQLWADGFRPIEAHALKHGMSVAYRETDVFQFAPIGDVHVTTVEDVRIEDEEGVVYVSTWDRGVVDVDMDEEVWVT